MESFETVVKQISSHTQPEQVIMDITSVKASPVAIMHQYLKSGVVLGGHPVFGPGAKDITQRSFILTPTNGQEETLAQKVKQYLETREARVTLMSPEEHDEVMAVVLGLAGGGSRLGSLHCHCLCRYSTELRAFKADGKHRRGYL
ncbi:MAG: prephenate dehydrogenase/arogenate dehydrogenase family protein [Dehalococcoidia bacterium]